MINAYKSFFKGYVDFTGRSKRSEYWWIWLTNMILLVPFYSAYFKALANPRNETALMALGGIAIIYMIFFYFISNFYICQTNFIIIFFV